MRTAASLTRRRDPAGSEIGVPRRDFSITGLARRLSKRDIRELAAAAAAALSVAVSLAAGGTVQLTDGLFYDLSLAAVQARPGTGGQPVAVIALDRDSLDADEIAATPRVFLGPYWAKVIEGLNQNGVRAVGFDLIFEYSANQFQGFEGHYDAGFLDALSRYRQKIVLARSARAYPAPAFAAAVTDLEADAGKEDPGALAFVELIPDSDGVNRRVSANLRTVDGRPVRTFAAALLERAGQPAMPDEVVIDPAAPLEAMPTYRLIDVVHCLDSDPAAIRHAFSGKVVLVGTTLPEEDRKRTPDRFMQPPKLHPVNGSGCRLDRLGASDPASRTTPGVFVHAAAVRSVLTGDLVHPLSAAVQAGSTVLTSMAGSLLGFGLGPWFAVLCIAGLALGCFGLAALLLPLGISFALTIPIGAALLSMIAAYVLRFVVEERRRRRVQHAFSHYLSPVLVDRLVENQAELHLGGELRELTAMFADLSGFTALSGVLNPTQLMDVTNVYLGVLAEAVQTNGGYVNLFLGDAVMATFGAPVADPAHAANAARAALQAVDSVMRMKADADRRGVPGYTVKVGINTGPAVAGNVGAERRYNYTAVGETVNVAARLEGVPPDYGCRIVIGPETAAAIADRFILCELDWIKVKGKEDDFPIYELLAENKSDPSRALAYTSQYEAALQRYRAGEFAAAAELWGHAAELRPPGGENESPPQVMAKRCAELLQNPPEIWDGVFVKTSK
jgi:adenylate cyclase